MATDLTSFFHVGDICCIDTKTGKQAFIEAKSGKINSEIHQAISKLADNRMDEFEKDTLAIIKSSRKPEKTAQQVLRVLKQYGRGTQAMKYRYDKSRIDSKTGDKVRIHIKDGEENWAVAVNDITPKIQDGDVGFGLVDGCLVFAYGKKPFTNLDKLAFRYVINDAFCLGMSPDEAKKLSIFALQTFLGLQTTTPRSLLFIQHLGPERQSRLMQGDEFLLVYLHIPAVSQLFKNHGLELKIKNTKAKDQVHVDQLLRELFGQNKIPVIAGTTEKGATFSNSILSGSWQRVIFDFMAPIELVRHIRLWLIEAER